MSKFGQQLKKIRESKGLSLSEVSLNSSISAAQLSRIENSKRGTPKPQTLKLIAKGLGVTFDELMSIAGYKSTCDLTDDELKVLNFYRENQEIIKLLINLDEKKLKAIVTILND